MQDLKKGRKKMLNNHQVKVNNQAEIEETNVEEISEDLSRGCGCSFNDDCNGKNKQVCHCECECVCEPTKRPKCEPCEIDSKDCVKNNCSTLGCCNAIEPKKFSTANSIPYAIEANRIYDTMLFQNFTDAVGPNGEPLTFEYDVIEVCGQVPRSGQVNVTIEEICINYSCMKIDKGCTTLEDYDIKQSKPRAGVSCDTSFEYSVCGQRNQGCCSKGRGTSVVYKQKGLIITVEDLVLELKGKCGCTTFTAVAYPAVKCTGGHLRRCSEVTFIFNTLSAPICLPSNGDNVILRQDFKTNLTVDCIGKAMLSYVDHDGCECYYDLCIPNDIDLVLCLQNTVSTLVNEQIVVLGSPNGISPRVVDTFNKVCDFPSCGENN